MIKVNSSIYKLSLFFLASFLFLGCEEDETGLELLVPSSAATAPPVREANNVKSLYSNAYTNGTVDSWNSPRESSTTEESFIQIAGDDVIRYSNFNFARVDFSSSPIDASRLSTFHIDIWTPNAIKEGSQFKVLLIDFGANGVFSGGDDSSYEITIGSSSLSSENWISLEIPLSDFTGLTSTSNIAQMVLSGTFSNLYIDNVYFYGETVLPPAAPVPTVDAADVLSIFSDTYTNVAGTDFYPNWGQPAPGVTVTETLIEGNNTLQYANFTYQGVLIAGDGNSIDVSTYGSLHLDYYSTNATALNVYLITASGGDGTPYALTVPTTGWNSVDIPLSDFAQATLNDVVQFKFDGGTGNDVFLDNIYFRKAAAAPTVPTVAAPVPTRAASGVLSIFSDTYTNVAGTEFFPNWGQSTVVTQTSIAGNNTLHYANFNYQGVLVGGAGNNIDVSAYGFIHIDYYSANGSALDFFLIGTNGVEKSSSLTLPTSGWSSADIPLSAFSGVDLSAIKEFKSDGGSGGDIYLDNIYFYGTAGSGSNCPTPPAGEFIVDSGFEANAGCWELFANGGEVGIVTNVNNGGSNSARIKTARRSNPGLKQTRFGAGVLQPNTAYVVKFDIRSDAADPLVASAVLNAFTFSESAEGSGGGAVQHILVGGDANVSSTWTTRTYTFTSAANIAGGASLLIELVTGDVEGASGTIFIDNVSFRAQ